ncbi:4-hydroxybenzoate octaprenyltransferase [Parvibaculum sp.]|uniref:4-hydroxybenzoate octaprenyltransferase n=2 Tax=Parvibaculum TaxID=256616 RepID=UPI000C892758|nr:4-hydroxybenzoate octaprenyltransferase [Parvibaculum sp.]MAB13145.1 4-hydroxybenzoate octaprenyltransferase [Parvibaculum sp.]
MTDEQTMQDRVADAAPENWVDAYAPAFTRPYLRLARADRPIGTWLLLLPGWWSIALAADLLPNIWLMVLFGVGAFVMRGAGCTYNDIVDRDFDAQVARTRSRPIPSGAVSLKMAWAFLALQCLIGLGILLLLTPFAIGLGVASLALIAAYPFMKRITYWPQAWLGLTFNWGALMGWAAVTDSLALAPVLLYVTGIAWTIGYDTIYAHQDKEDDALIGVKSTALRFGRETVLWMWLFYGLTALGLLLAGLAAGLGFGFYLLWPLGVLHLAQQILRLDTEDPQLCLSLFRSNRDFGLIILVAIVAGALTG